MGNRVDGARVTQFWCETVWPGDGSLLADVLITVEHGLITNVVADQLPGAATVLPGLVIPGLANAHSHAFHRALRGRTQRDRGSFWTWRDLMYQVAEQLDPDSYYQLARGVYGEMVLAGITSVGEFHYLHHGPGGTPYANPNIMRDSLIAAAADAGIRITVLDTCYLTAAVDGTALHGPQLRFTDGTADGWAERAVADDGTLPTHVKRGAAIHSVRAVPLDAMQTVVRAAQGVPLHFHSSEQRAEVAQCMAAYDGTPTQVLESVGALGPLSTAVHHTHLTPGDVAMTAATATGVCFCPTTERDLGDGIGPAPALIEAGGLFSLGSDSHAVIDMFEEARAVELNERLSGEHRGVIAAQRLLQAATRDGQLALGWSDAGAIARGQRADLVALTTTSIRAAGLEPGPELAVFAATAADVTDVVVDGQHRVRGSQHVAFDPAAELHTAISAILAEL